MARPRCSSEPRVVTAVRLPLTLRGALGEAASEREVSINLLVTRAISEYLARLPELGERPAPATEGRGL